MNITNRNDIPLGLAVWLVHDEYDYIKEPNYISVTSLMKPLRHIILPPRVPKELQQSDVEDFVARAMGHSLHDSIEKAWKKGHKRSLKLMGYPDSAIDRILINPTPEQLAAVENPIPVYLEQRAFRKITINGVTYTIGGKFDMAADYILHDNKSTTSYTWLYGTRDDEHKLQGSLYRWLDKDGYTDSACTQPIIANRIKEDFIRINYIFTDWQKMSAKQNPKYPQSRILYKDIPLMSDEEIETWVKWKIGLVERYKNTPENQLPECTDEELWRSSPVYKYYVDPTKTDGKSTKNFENPVEARQHLSEKGKGIVITVPGEVKRCGYCSAFPVCTQKDRYFQ